MRRSPLLLLLLTAGLGGACGARSSLSASSRGASSSGGTASGAGGAGSEVGGSGSGTGGALPQKVWSRQRAGKLAAHPLAVDGEGHIWLFGGTLSDDGSPGKVWTSAHLWKLSPQGDPELDVSYDGGAGFHVIPQAIHADAAGGVLLAGTAFRQPSSATTLDLGGTSIPFPFAQSAFLVKLDAAGKYVWSHVYDAGDTGSEPYGSVGFVNLGADAAGRWRVLTYAHSPVDLGAGPVSNDGPILLVLSPTGDHLSEVLLPDVGWVSLNLAVEPSGHTWLAGGSQTCSYGVQVQRFNPAGKLLMEACPPSTCWAEIVDLAPDGAGGMFVTEAAGGADHCDDQIFLRRLDATGDVAWTLHGKMGVFGTTVATTPTGHAAMGASYYGSFELGSGPLAEGESQDTAEVFLGDIDPGGKVLSAAHFGGEGEQQIVATAIDPVAARVIAGQLTGVVDFGDGPQKGLSDSPDDTLFVARIPE